MTSVTWGRGGTVALEAQQANELTGNGGGCEGVARRYEATAPSSKTG